MHVLAKLLQFMEDDVIDMHDFFIFHIFFLFGYLCLCRRYTYVLSRLLPFYSLCCAAEVGAVFSCFTAPRVVAVLIERLVTAGKYPRRMRIRMPALSSVQNDKCNLYFKFSPMRFLFNFRVRTYVCLFV